MGISVLGRLEIDESAGRLGPRDRVVLSALALWLGEVVSAERLADALWHDGPPPTWPKVVQGCIVRLRKALGSRAIETASDGYRLVLPSDHLDARRFERLVGRGRELLALGEPERADYVLGEAIGLWRGPAFMELDGWDAGRAERERLDELRRDAEELQVDAELRAGRAGEVVARAQTCVTQAPLRERRWSLLALAQYQAGRQSDALRTIREVRRLLAAELGLDPGPDLVALEGAILRQDPALAAGTALPEPSQNCPYRGLVPYDVLDSDGYFGRESDVARCVRRLAEQGVLIVVGPSGSGKSSLVRAGVAASLTGDGRHVSVISPGIHPMDAMTALPARGPTPVLVVDQCEEAVTLCQDPAERAAFFQALVAHADRSSLVVAVRADHMSDLGAYPPFARMVERGLYLLGDMDSNNLRACIEGPARQAGLLLEPGLVDLLVREVEGEPGALPLLSHALRQTWSNREGRTLTVAGYVATGGIREAVARTAEEVYAETEPGQQDLVRDLMLRLVVPSPDGDPVRSRMPRRMVAADAEHERVVERLVAARLVTSDDGVLVLAHEAVARAWPRLQQWLEEDTEGRRILRHLPVAADSWDSMGRPDSELYRGSRLVHAAEWRDRTRPKLSPVEREFLDASAVLANVELEAARQRADDEARAQRRTRRLAGGLAVVLVLAVVAAATATYFERTASQRADEAAAATVEADANRLAALSRSVGSLDLSLLLAAQAAQMADTAATQDGLLSTLVRHRRAIRVAQLRAQPADVELAANGKTMFVARQPWGILALDVDSADQPRVLNNWQVPSGPNVAASQSGDVVAAWRFKAFGVPQVGVFGPDGTPQLHVVGLDRIGGWPETLGLSPDGRRLLISVAIEPKGDTGYRSVISEIDVASGETVRNFSTGLESPDSEVTGTIADNGSSAVSWVRDDPTTARMIDLRTGRSAWIRVLDRPASVVGYVPLSTGAALRWSDGAVSLYDRQGRPIEVLDAHQAEVNDVVVSPDRTWAASGDDTGAVIVWAIDPGTGTWTQRESLVGHAGAVTGVAVDPRGRTLVTVSRDGTAISWDLSARAGFGSGGHGLPDDRWISNVPEVITPGQLVVAPTRPAPPDGFDNLAGATDLSVYATFLNPETGAVVADVRVTRKTFYGSFLGSSVAVSPDRTMVAVTHGVGVTVLDTRTREVLARIEMPPASPSGEPDWPEGVWCSAWTPDGSRLLLCADGEFLVPGDGNLLVVDTATWQPAAERIPIGGAAQTVRLSPDGRLLAVGTTFPPTDSPPLGEIKILDAGTFELKRVLTIGPGEMPYDARFSPDGTMLATGGLLGQVAVFDVATGRLLHAPARVHRDFLGQTEWLPDNRTVVTTGADGMIALYDTKRGLIRATMPASAEGGRGYTYLTSVSSAEVTAASRDRPARTYTLRPDRWLAYACTVAGRDLTKDEWASYLGDRPYQQTCDGPD